MIKGLYLTIGFLLGAWAVALAHLYFYACAIPVLIYLYLRIFYVDKDVDKNWKYNYQKKTLAKNGKKFAWIEYLDEKDKSFARNFIKYFSILSMCFLLFSFAGSFYISFLRGAIIFLYIIIILCLLGCLTKMQAYDRRLTERIEKLEKEQAK